MRRFLAAEVPRAILRLLAAFALYGLAGLVPWPAQTLHWAGVAAFGLLAAAIVVVCGKLLYDTLFYDHHWRHVDGK